MDSLTRRSFLSQALMAGAGASFFRPHEILSGVKLASLLGSMEPDYDPGFVAGKIIASSETTLLILDLDDQLRQARLTSTSQTWKRGLWNTTPPSVGDCTYARGTPSPDGSIDVDRLWIDIQSVSAEVVAATAGSFTVLLPTDQVQTLLVAPFTQVETPSGDWVSGTAEGLASGQAIQLVAFGDSLGGLPTATMVSLLSDSVPAVEQVAADPTFLVLGTWYCCGGVQACGSSGSCLPGSGACGVCRSDRKQTAYPRLSTTNCEKCGTLSCCLALPMRACGASATIVNPCNNSSVSVRIQDCIGSTASHSSVGCKSRHCRVLDLTPCAFSAIGNLDSGIINMNISV